MIVSKVQNQPNPDRVVVVPPQVSAADIASAPQASGVRTASATQTSPAKSATAGVSAPQVFASQDRIRARAFAIYEKRGSEAGSDMQDWLRAERQIQAR
jgi:hypothetical protein